MHISRHQSGFSLVELSIVLVILGLLVGGILGGQSLIRAAELRKVITEREQLATALNSFRIKYNALPGDFDKATRLWDMDEDCTPAAPCNGNGDGVIMGAETYFFWNHLARAGLAAGHYKMDWLSPRPADAFQISASGWGYWMPLRILIPYDNPPTHEVYVFEGLQRGKNVFMLMDIANIMTTSFSAAIPEEVWQIDLKIDDGSPATGMLTTLTSVFIVSPEHACAVTGTGVGATRTDRDAVYDLSHRNAVCVPLFTF